MLLSDLQRIPEATAGAYGAPTAAP
jgi:hypothetical protein